MRRDDLTFHGKYSGTAHDRIVVGEQPIQRVRPQRVSKLIARGGSRCADCGWRLAEGRHDSGAGMTGGPRIMGRAVFGTARDLVMQGNGVLANTPVAAFEFDAGRRRSGLLDRMRQDEIALFFRRLDNGNGAGHVNLVGMLAPCRDAHNRAGFMGAGIALEPDPHKPRPQFADWSALLPELNELMNAVFALRSPETGVLSWRRVLGPLPDDRPTSWRTANGGTLLLHADESTGDDDIVPSLQAMAFRHGAHHATMLVCGAAMTCAIPLSASVVRDALRAFRKARMAARRQPEPARHDPHNGLRAARPKVPEPVEDLQCEVEAVRNEADVLRVRALRTPDETSAGRYIPWIVIEVVTALVLFAAIAAAVLNVSDDVAPDVNRQDPPVMDVPED